MSESGSLATNNLEKIEEKNQFEGYRKTCSTVFGKANQSQLKYIQALSDLQQAMWASCESMVAKQISAFEGYSKTNHDAGHMESLLQIYTSMIDASMKWVVASYDSGIVRLQLYRNNIERFNEMMPQTASSTSPQKKTTHS